jgi:hypothetical protein
VKYIVLFNLGDPEGVKKRVGMDEGRLLAYCCNKAQHWTQLVPFGMHHRTIGGHA